MKPAPIQPAPRFPAGWPARGFVILTLLVAALWLWINYCRFPSSSWNDIRLVPVFMAAAGEPVYTLPGQGVITTWMYGPVPLWIWSPALLGANPVAAALIADGVNLALTILALALTCAFWPMPGAGRRVRWLAFAGAVALWPDHAFRFLQADNVSIAFGLLANLALITSCGRPRSTRAWMAALATAAALGCKQTSAGLLLAQCLWLWLDFDTKTAFAHLGRTTVAGAVLALAAASQFGFRELWFGLVEIPTALPRVEDALGHLWEFCPFLLVQWGLPMVTLGVLGKRILRPGHPLRLPLLAWLCSLPLGLAGLLSTGGSINNLQGFNLFIAPLLLCLLAALTPWRTQWCAPLTSFAVALIVSLRIFNADDTPARPDFQIIRQAMSIQASFPGQVWLPWNPLVSYFAEHRFYHAEDGIYVRFITGHPVSLAQTRAHLPPHFHAMAFPSPQMQWGVAAKLAPADHTTRKLGNWEILVWPLDTP